jgi:TolB-like protein
MLEYRGSTKSLPQIGRDLKVKTLLEGTVLRSGDNVRISGGSKSADRRQPV